jgi:copper(I)-binding protein
MTQFKKLAVTACLSTLMGSALAHGVTCGELAIAHPYSTPTLGMSKVGAVYFKGIENKGKEADQLLSAKTAIAASVEIHEMVMDGDVMKMRPVPELSLPPGATVPLNQGQTKGHHLMLMGLSKPLKKGDAFPVTLSFKRAGECQAEVHVQDVQAGAHQH